MTWPGWLRDLLDAWRNPFDVFRDTEPHPDDDEIPDDFPGPTTEPSNWGALDGCPERPHP